MNTMRRQARLFRLVRHADASGLRGTGTLAEGVEWSDGSVALRWRGPWASTSSWDRIDALLAVHGADGRTVVHWSSETTPVEVAPAKPSSTPASMPAPKAASVEQPSAVVWLPAPGADGLCSRCGRFWPCLSCGP
ncbi:hypothetical protein [Kribbella antibiotica]|uniref:hypothetical protein n=1 Tax=Kribbella antibiotica TaxID=190195 RepID=UPI00192DD80A|nr:hypothetical protein [Kribbella antibiotica]